MRTIRRVARGTMRGALIGAVLSLLILAEFLLTMAAGNSARDAGYGSGMLSWLASVPIGLAILYEIVFPVARALGSRDSIPRNMTLILLFGVVGNWAALGTIYETIWAVVASLRSKRSD